MNELAWDDVRYFLAVAKTGGLSAAARELGVEHSTVGRRVSVLEERLGLRLFDRLPRNWQLTREGATLLETAQRLESEALAFSRAARGMTAMQGTVRLSGPPDFTSDFLMPLLAAHHDKWAGIMLDLVGEVRAANLHRRDADLAIRASRPEEPGLVVRRLGSIGYALYGASKWLDVPPKERAYLGFGETLHAGPHQAWLTQYSGGAPCLLVANDFATLFEAARAGLGVAVLPHFIVGDDPKLIALDSAGGSMRRELWLVVHQDVRRSPRVQLVADLIAELVRENAELLG